MKRLSVTAIRSSLRTAFPLPALLAGYLLGLLFCFWEILSAPPSSPILLRPQTLWAAFADYTALELPFWIVCTLLGFFKLPESAALPVLGRAILFGYGSLQVYLSAGKGLLYFLYVLGNVLTLLPLCCVAKLAMKQSAICKRLTGNDPVRYLFRCLYYWGLTLIILFLRSSIGALIA